MASNALTRDTTGALQLAGAPAAAPAVTPAGAKVQGANPDVAKMSGTPAQKAPVLQQAVAPTQTLGGPSAAPQTPVATAQDVASEAVGQRLSALGAYGARVKALVNQRLTSMGQAAPQLDQGAVDKFVTGIGGGADQATAVRSALTQYVSGGRTEADLAKLATAAGLPSLSAGALSGLFTNGGPAAVAPVTVKDLDLSQLGVDLPTLAHDLDTTPDALAGLTPAQLNRAIADKVNRSFDDTDALKAELPGATPARAAQIRAEIGRREATGVSVADTAAQQLAQAIQSADKITIGGRETSVEDALKDENVSAAVKQALASPAGLAQLAADQPGLAAWVKANQQALKDFTAGVGTQVDALAVTNSKYQSTVSGIDPALQDVLGVSRQGAVTSDDLADVQTKLATSPVYSAMQTDDATKQLLQGPNGPALAKRLKDSGLSAQGIAAAVATSNTINSDDALASVLGLKPGQPLYLLTHDQQTLLPQVQKDLAALPEGTRGTPGWLSLQKARLLTPLAVQAIAQGALDPKDQTFADLVSDGTITSPRQVQAVAHDKTILPAIATERKERAQLAQAGNDPKQLRALLFGNAYADPQAIAAGSKYAFDWTTRSVQPLLDPTGSGIDASDSGMRNLAARVAAAMPTDHQLISGHAPEDPTAKLLQVVRNALNWGQSVQQGNATANAPKATLTNLTPGTAPTAAPAPVAPAPFVPSPAAAGEAAYADNHSGVILNPIAVPASALPTADQIRKIKNLPPPDLNTQVIGA